jgi:uncharacterized protein (DUF111 family)
VSREARVELERWTEKVDTTYGPMQVKRARLNDGSVKTSPEYESCRSVAESCRVPIGNAYEAARAGRPLTTRKARPRKTNAVRPRGK